MRGASGGQVVASEFKLDVPDAVLTDLLDETCGPDGVARSGGRWARRCPMCARSWSTGSTASTGGSPRRTWTVGATRVPRPPSGSRTWTRAWRAPRHHDVERDLLGVRGLASRSITW